MLIQKNIALCDKNTYQIGGVAAYYCEPCNEDEIVEAVEWAENNRTVAFILGKGSNVLISDHGWPGMVINVSEAFREIAWNGNRAVAQSGVMLNMLVNQAIERGFSGMEELCGIPGTIGGAVVMNAGAFSMCIENTVEWVRYYDCAQKRIIIGQKDQLGFGYRTSNLQTQSVVILTAGFQFDNKKSVEELAAKRIEIQSKRREKQPLDYPNCGSVFKRPPDNFAGTLIEKCGLKGKRVGDAEVSVKHANFIVNRGNASAEDVRNLIIFVQKEVYERTSVMLEPEVRFIGQFEHGLYKQK